MAGVLGRALGRRRWPDAADVAPAISITPELAGIPRTRLTMPKAFDSLEAPPTFITGVARSGTTWALDLFDRHPDVCAVFESWILTQTHGVTALLSQPQWSPEFYDAQRRNSGLDHAAVQLVPYEEMVGQLGELVAGWLMRAVQPGQRFLVEKSPLDLAATATLFPEARFVHVIRDGRDVAVSMDVASESWAPEMGRMPLFVRGRVWASGVQKIRSIGETLGDRYMEISYENLKGDFIGATRRMFEFAGVPRDDALLEQIREQTQLDKSYGSATRESRFRGQGRTGGWPERFGLRDALRFDRAAGELLVELGYARDRRWWRRRQAI
jgi:sulfotransferase family protein